MEGFRREVLNNILPYWIEKLVDEEYGGFFGRLDGKEQLHRLANKGAVLNMRILWTFSAAYRIFKNPQYEIIAKRTYDYINKYFIDSEFGGVYWELDYEGNPINTKKQVYAQGFALYGFSEYYRATGNLEALEKAKEFFHLIEKHKDHVNGGYFEAFGRDWMPISDVRLSDKDANESKSMNTHLHILEPYTNLLRVWKSEELMMAQKDLINIFQDKVLNKKNCHLNLFFDDTWNVKSSTISYGHDIEASWLLLEAAEVLGDNKLLIEIKKLALKIADTTSEGISPDGSMIYEKDKDHSDEERHWWVQAEGILGFMYVYKLSDNDIYKHRADHLWKYIQEYIVDKDCGEWYWSRKPDGTVNRIDDKAGFWKCPYHNSRMCMEMIENFDMK